VLYETKGELTVVRETGSDHDGALVRAGLADTAGFEAPRPQTFGATGS